MTDFAPGLPLKRQGTMKNQDRNRKEGRVVKGLLNSCVFAGNFPNASLAESIDVSDANAGLTYFHRRIGLARILPKNVPSVQDRGR